MELFYQHMAELAILFYFSRTSRHLHPLQVENCDSNLRLVVDEDHNGNLRLERVKEQHCKGLRSMALYSTLYCTFTLHCTALHCTALHCTALHCTALHCTALH